MNFTLGDQVRVPRMQQQNNRQQQQQQQWHKHANKTNKNWLNKGYLNSNIIV
jgi:hypothetical protein